MYIETKAIMADKEFSKVVQQISQEFKDVVMDPVTKNIVASLANTVFRIYMMGDLTNLHYILTDIHDILRSRHNWERAIKTVHLGCADIMKNEEKQEVIAILVNGLAQDKSLIPSKDVMVEELNPTEELPQNDS